MKVLTWNVNRAGRSRQDTWEMVRREDADIVLLQEVTALPCWMRWRYQCHWVTPRYFDGSHARFSSAVLSKGAIDATPYLASGLEWVDDIYRGRCGWIIGCKSTLDSGERFRVVAVHSPAFRVPRDQYDDADAAGIKLTNNPDLWFTDILYALLRTAGIADDANWIVGGDFNLSVRFDEPKDRGNGETLRRLNCLGLTDCLSHAHGGAGVVPTFQHTSKAVEDQLDYCFVSPSMLGRLARVRVPDPQKVFGRKPRLSDHLPILCEFE